MLTSFNANEECFLVMLMLVILMLIVMLINLYTDYAVTDLIYVSELCPCAVTMLLISIVLSEVY